MAAKKPLNKNLVGLLISVGIVILAPVIGLLVTVLYLRSAFGGTAHVDPSQKARVLAEGISEAMNGTACGLVVSCLAFVPAVVFALRLYRDSKSPPPGPG